MANTFPCPKCGRSLDPMGMMSIADNDEVPVFQCDDCVVVVTAMGIEAEAAFTFVVKDGQAFDPTAPDDPLLPSEN